MGNHQETPGPAQLRQTIKVRAVTREKRKGVVSTWNVEVLKDGAVIRHTCIRDPFEPSEEENLHWYIQDYARFSPFETQKAEKSKESVCRYARSLIRSLGLPGIIDSTVSMVLEIEADHDCFSFHSLHWECLEFLDYWPQSGRQGTVYVRRVVPSIISPIPTKQKRRVLIVSSRNPEPGKQDIAPRQVSYPAIRALEKVNRQFAVDIEAVLVRPGTFEALENHLRQYGPGYFDLLHIDVHGSIKDGKPQLEFFSPHGLEAPTVRLVTPCDLGRLLREFEIYNVVTNACNSGKTGVDVVVDFAGGLIMQGAHNAAAMSFAVSITAATIFIESFYTALFLQGQSFVDAVVSGRTALASQPRRPARFNTEVDVCDFFVPIVFSSTGVREDLYSTPRMEARDSPGFLYNLAKRILEMIPRDRGIEPGQPDLKGRESDLAKLERDFIPLYREKHPPTNLLLIYGLLGTGKSCFAEHVCWWWKSSGLANHFLVVRIRPGVFSSPVPTVMKELQRKLAASSMEDLVTMLRKDRILVLLDDLDNLTQWSPRLEDRRHQAFDELLTRINGGNSIVILTSTCPEAWISPPIHRFKLNGLKDADTSVAIMNSVTKQKLSHKNGDRNFKSFEKIAELVFGNPSALRVVCSGINASAISSQEHYLKLRRHVTSEMINTWSSSMGGWTISRSAVKTKKFLEESLGAPPDGGILYASLVLHAGRVQTRWIPFLAAVTEECAQSEQGSTVQMVLEMFNTMVAELQDLGLLELDADHFNINPLFTYMGRIKIQSGSLSSPSIVDFLKSASRSFYLYQLAEMRISSANLAEMKDANNALEREYLEYLNIFDDLLEHNINRDAKVMPTLDNIVNLESDEEEAIVMTLPFNSISKETLNNEGALYGILEQFLLQNINTSRLPFTEESISMCERYLRRLGLDMSHESQSPMVSQNLCMPAITSIGWLVQYWLGLDPPKAKRYLELGLSLCALGIAGESGKQRIMYRLYQCQLLLLKATISMLLGDEETAKILNTTVMEFKLPDREKEGVEEFIDPFVASLRANASHGLYNVALSQKSIDEAIPEKNIAEQAWRKLGQAVAGSNPGERLDDSEPTEFADLAWRIMGTWNMGVVSKSLQFEQEVQHYFPSSGSYLHNHGLCSAEKKLQKLSRRRLSCEDRKRELQRELESCIRTQDDEGAVRFHEELIEYYAKADDWEAACMQLLKLEQMDAQKSPGLLRGTYQLCINIENRILRDLRNGVASLFGNLTKRSYDYFSKVVTKPEDCHKAFIGIDTKSQLSFARRLIRAKTISENDVLTLCSQIGAVGDHFAVRLCELSTIQNEHHGDTVEDILEKSDIGSLEDALHYDFKTAAKKVKFSALKVQKQAVTRAGLRHLVQAPYPAAGSIIWGRPAILN